MQTPKLIGETTITTKIQVSLPAHALRSLGWKRGDRLLVEAIDDDIVLLIRRPENWTEYFAGRLTDVCGKHDDNIRYVEAERRSWEGA